MKFKLIDKLQLRRNLANLVRATSELKQATKQHRQFFKRIASGLGLALAILVLIGFVSFRSIVELVRTENSAQRSRQIIEKLEHVLTDMINAETGQRDYVITGEESYLEPYNRAIGELKQDLKDLKRLNANNPVAKEQLDSLEQLMAQRFDLIQQTINLRKYRGFQSSLNFIMQQQNKRAGLGNEIYLLVSQMEKQERILLEDRQQAAKASAKKTIVTFSTGILLGFAILAGVYWLIYREMNYRKQVEVSLKQERNFISAILDTTSALVVVLDPQGKIIRFNRACEQTTGYAVEEVMDLKFWNIFLFFIEMKSFHAVFASGERGNFPNDYENYCITKDGRRRLIAWSNTALLDKDGEIEYIIATGIDRTERRQAEQRLLAQHAVTRILAAADSLTEAIANILQAMCFSLEWEWGELWRVDKQTNRLRCVQIWHVPSLAEREGDVLAEFEAQTRSLLFVPGEGLPGEIWQSGKPGWVVDGIERSDRARLQLASKLGMQGVFGFPIQAENETLGVIAFFSREINQPEVELLQMATAIGSVIGQFIQRKRVERNLRDSEEKYRSVINNVKEVIFQTDAKGFWTFLNPAWTEITGFLIDDTIGTYFVNYIHPEDRQRSINLFQPLLKGKQEYSRHEVRYLTFDGNYRWIEVYARATKDDSGAIAQIAGTLNDITERMQTQEALRVSQERYELAISAGNVGVWDWDILTNQIYIDPTIKASLGYTELDIPNTLVGWHSLIHPDDRRRVLDATKLHLQGKTSHYEIEHRRLHKNGSLRWFLSRATAFQDAEGRMCRMTGTDTDITERKLTQEALERERQQLQQIIASAPVAMAMFDTNLCYLAHSNKWLTDYNLEGSSIVGCSHYQVFPDIPDAWKAIYQRALNGEKLANPEDIFERHDGSKIYLRWAIEPWRQPDGSVGGIVIVTDRINELVEAREAALEASRFKSQFLANMSHEIRTPMNAVLGMTGLLLETPLNSEQQDFVQTIRVSGDALLSLINEILDFSKLEVGEMELETLDFNLSTCIEEVLDLLAPQADAKGLEIAAIVEQNVPICLQGDAGRLRQILTNLIGNAIKFTPTGQVVVQAQLLKETQATATLYLAVIDTGIGIASPDQAKLFSSFTQVDASITRNYGGTGLGLAICQELVTLMGGEIGLESQLGKGSKFWFSIPFKKQKISDPEPVPKPLNQRRLLVVDGSVTHRQGIYHQAIRWGMQVDEASSAAAARKLLENTCQPYDLALIDIVLIEQIQTHSALAGMPLILLASPHQREKLPQLDIGFASYLAKPVKFSRLLETIIKVLEIQIQSVTKDEETESELPIPHASLSIPKLRILLAEDNIVNQKVALKQLQGLGYEADVAANGEEVLQLLTRIPYDLILMDCQMPLLDGLETTREIHRREALFFASGYRPMIVAMTANAREEDRQMCLEAGMDDYLSKPVSKEKLAEVLERFSQTIYPPEVSPDGEDMIISKEENFPDLDWDYLHNIADNNAEFEAELLQIFLEDTRVHLEATAKAIASTNFAKIERSAHHIKGSSGNIGAKNMQVTAGKLEQLARSQQLEGASELLENLQCSFQRIQQTIPG